MQLFDDTIMESIRRHSQKIASAYFLCVLITGVPRWAPLSPGLLPGIAQACAHAGPGVATPLVHQMGITIM